MALRVLRGDPGPADEGEDVDPDAPTDWRAVAVIAVALVAHALLLAQLALVGPVVLRAVRGRRPTPAEVQRGQEEDREVQKAGNTGDRGASS